MEFKPAHHSELVPVHTENHRRLYRLDRIVKELLSDPNITMLAGANGELLYKKLDDVRKHGYALNDEAYVSGVRAIGAPVFNHKGKVDAGINIPVFSHMVSRDELIQRYLPLLLKTTENLSSARGFLQRSDRKIITMKKGV